MTAKKTTTRSSPKPAPTVEQKEVAQDIKKMTSLPFTTEQVQRMAAPAQMPEQGFAKSVVDAVKARKAKAEAERIRKRDEGKLFGVECRYCRVPTLFFAGNPKTNLVRNEVWFTDYKPLGLAWHGRKPHCSLCKASMPVRIDGRGRGIVVVGRFASVQDLSDLPEEVQSILSQRMESQAEESLNV